MLKLHNPTQDLVFCINRAAQLCLCNRQLQVLFLAENTGDGCFNYKLFQPCLLDWLQLAAVVTLPSGTLVVVLHGTRFARSAVAHQHGATLAAERFRSQKIFFLGFGSSGRSFILIQAFLCPVE